MIVQQLCCNREEEDGFNFREELKKYFVGSLFTAFWTFLVVIGGAVLILYFASINYTPEFDLKSSTTLIAFVSIASLVFTISFMIMIIAPGLVWKGYGKMEPTVYDNFVFRASSEPSLIARFIQFMTNDDFRRMLTIFVSPILILIVLIFIGASYQISELCTAVLIFGFIAVCTFLYWLIIRDISKAFMLGFILLFSFMLVSQNLVLTLKLVMKSPYGNQLMDFVAGGFFIIIALISNVFVSVSVRNLSPYIWVISIAIMTFIMMIFIFKAFLLIPESAMRLFKYGNYDLEVLAIKGDTCNAIKQSGSYDLNDSEFCLFEDVHVYSSVGTSYYFNYKHKSGNDQLIVKKTDVLYSVTNSCEKDVDVGNNYRCENDRPKQ